MGIKIKYSTVSNLRGNSIIERVYKTINEIMRLYHHDKLKRDLTMMIFLRLNIPPNRNIGVTLFLLFRKFNSGTYNEVWNYEEVLIKQ